MMWLIGLIVGVILLLVGIAGLLGFLVTIAVGPAVVLVAVGLILVVLYLVRGRTAVL